MNELIKKYFEKKLELDKVTEELEMIKAELKSEMIELGEEYYENEDGCIVSYKEQERKSLDKNLVQKKLAPEVFDECFKTSKFSVLRVMTKEEREILKKFR